MGTEGGGTLPARRINDIFIDPSGTDPDEIVYVAFGGLGQDADDNLWRTTDNGDSWSDITGGTTNCSNPNNTLIGLPCVPVRTVTVQPGDPATIYAGTEIGIYVTHDSGDHWLPVMEGPSNVSIIELSFMNTSELLVGTYGRGIWVAKVGCNPVTPNRAPNDFDGDGLTDIAVVRPTPLPSGTPMPSTWHTMQSCRDYSTTEFGLRGDQVAPGDFDGDGKTDRAVFREDSGAWHWIATGDPGPTPTPRTFYYGTTGDIAVPADYDGDNIDDIAVWRPSNGYWYIRQSSDDQDIYVQWGEEDDVPAPADYDGDGNDDQAVFRLKNGIWWLNIEARTISFQFGLEGDVPVAGYYDDDASADIAVWRPSEGRWYIAFAAGNYETYQAVSWGLEDDVAVPGDYDGDGRTDIAVWRPSDGIWYILESTNGFNAVHFGSEGDIPTNRKTVNAVNNRQIAKTEPPAWARPQRQPPAFAR